MGICLVRANHPIMLDSLRKSLVKTQSEPAFYISQEIKFPVFVFDLHDEVDNEQILSKMFIDWDNSNRKDLVIDGYQSTYIKKDNERFYDYFDLIQTIENKANSVSTQKYKVNAYWYVVYKKNSRQNWHDHVTGAENGGIVLSAVYYAKVDDKSSPLVFLTTGNQLYKFQPKQQQLILFDSRLRHCVPENDSDDLRVSFAFNLINS